MMIIVRMLLLKLILTFFVLILICYDDEPSNVILFVDVYKEEYIAKQLILYVAS